MAALHAIGSIQRRPFVYHKDMLVALLATLLLFYITLAVHELGHYLLLRRYGVPVSVVAFGGPPWVLRFRVGETEFRLGLLFLFAYVQPKGEGSIYDTRLPLPPLKAVAVFLAGPLANLLIALPGVAGMLLLGGFEMLLRLGAALSKLPGLILSESFRMLTFQSEVGKVGIATSIGYVSEVLAKGDPLLFLGIFVALNVAVAFFNLLPMPPLDGGQALLHLFPEKPWVKRLEVGLTLLGVGLIVGLTVVSLGYDLLNFLR